MEHVNFQIYGKNTGTVHMDLSQKYPLFREVKVYMNKATGAYFRKSFIKYSNYFKEENVLHRLLRSFAFLIQLRDFVSEQIVEDTIDLMDKVTPHLADYVDTLVDSIEMKMERPSKSQVGIKYNIKLAMCRQ